MNDLNFDKKQLKVKTQQLLSKSAVVKSLKILILLAHPIKQPNDERFRPLLSLFKKSLKPLIKINPSFYSRAQIIDFDLQNPITPHHKTTTKGSQSVKVGGIYLNFRDFVLFCQLDKTPLPSKYHRNRERGSTIYHTLKITLASPHPIFHPLIVYNKQKHSHTPNLHSFKLCNNSITKSFKTLTLNFKLITL